MNNILKNLFKYKRIFISFFIAVIIEVVICNFNTFRVFFLSDEDKNVEVEYTYLEKENQLYVQSINKKIYNVSLDIKENVDRVCEFKIKSYSPTSPNQNIFDETEKMFSNIKWNRKTNKTDVLKINNPYKIENLYVSFLDEDDDNIEDIIGGIKLNVNDFEFNFVRTFILFFICFAILSRKSYFFIKKVDVKKHLNSKIYIVTMLIVAVIFSIYTCSDCIIDKSIITVSEEKMWSPKNSTIVVYSLFKQTEAFINGSIDIQVDTEELQKLANPYDPSERDVEDVYYLFDIAYYHGRYFQYFSILINLFILPFRLISGVYYDITIYASIIVFILVIVASLFYKKMVEKHIKKCSGFSYYLGYFAFLICSSMLCATRALAYEFQIMFGQIFFMISMMIILSIEKSDKHELIKYMLLGISTALIVISKPSMAVLYIIITYYYVNLLKEKKYSKKQLIKIVLATFSIFTIIAVFQMIYNYVRFNSIFEFGTKYQLTVADMRYCTTLSLNRILYGLLYNLFSMPTYLLTSFPFINEGGVYEQSFGINEFMFKHYTIGIMTIPITYMLFFKNKVKSSKIKRWTNIAIITSLILMLVNIIFAGVSDRYLMDTRLLLVMSAVLIYLNILESFSEEPKANEKLMIKFLKLIIILSIVVMLPVIINYEGAAYKFIDKLIIKNMFMFWI